MFPFLFYGAQFRTSICSEEERLQLLLPHPARRRAAAAGFAARRHVTGSSTPATKTSSRSAAGLAGSPRCFHIPSEQSQRLHAESAQQSDTL